ncbi:SH2 domain-containing protein 1A-like [Clupea harengus]|uniref:SH2 domain-containing protein 1A-like n=1 Tax=Clupea harengus TaxID=7950 RepID=A0A6P8ERE5_CLUHA|nr:SH2 domain-containing protein 1A-like [Clupea harengus]
MESIYYGKISKEVTERLLQRFGKDGSYLLRDSESLTGVLCLCVRKAPFVHTYRIEQSPHGWAVETVSGEPQYFESVGRLVESYRAKTPRNLEPLLYPLEKDKLSMETVQCTGTDYWQM